LSTLNWVKIFYIKNNKYYKRLEINKCVPTIYLIYWNDNTPFEHKNIKKKCNIVIRGKEEKDLMGVNFVDIKKIK